MRDIIEAYNNIGIELNSFSEAEQMFENDNIDDNERIRIIANLINRCVKELKYLKSEVRKDNEQYQNYISWSQDVCETGQKELISFLADLMIKYRNKNSRDYIQLISQIYHLNEILTPFEKGHFETEFLQNSLGINSAYSLSIMNQTPQVEKPVENKYSSPITGFTSAFDTFRDTISDFHKAVHTNKSDNIVYDIGRREMIKMYNGVKVYQ